MIRNCFCLLLGVVGMGLASSCYLLNQGIALFDTYAGAMPIDRLIAHDRSRVQFRLEDGELEFLQRVEEIRQFASQLGLVVSKNYTHYKRLKRDYLVDVVQAAPEFSVEAYMWTYPFMGALPYRGYFDRAGAEKERDRLISKGYEAFVRQVDAFSTLGILQDPIFSFFSNYSLPRLVELILHESTHATIYLAGHGRFNEALAMSVARVGTRQWLSQQANGEAALAEWEAQTRDYEVFYRLVAELREQRRKLFADTKHLGLEQIRVQRAEHARIWFAQYRERYAENFVGDEYRAFGDRDDVSNAWLAMFGVYEGFNPIIEESLARHNYDIASFLQSLNKIPRTIKDPFAWLSAQNIVKWK
jgi:predicted aminopeptidase